MILDDIENIDLYENLPQSLFEGLCFLRQNISRLAVGPNAISAEPSFVVSEYITKSIDECLFEAHRKFIDIQFVLAGSERIYVENISHLVLSQEYNESKDCTLYEMEENANFVTLKACRNFVIFFPEDGHAPGIQIKRGLSELVKKVVIKIPV